MDGLHPNRDQFSFLPCDYEHCLWLSVFYSHFVFYAGMVRMCSKLKRILIGYVLFAVAYVIAVYAELRGDGSQLVMHTERYIYQHR
jgi:hypothetical protein